jgi:hypothetical protein
VVQTLTLATDPLRHEALRHNMRVFIDDIRQFGYISAMCDYVIYDDPEFGKCAYQIRPDSVLRYAER